MQIDKKRVIFIKLGYENISSFNPANCKIEHDLNLVRVCSIDTPERKLLCKVRCMYGLQMIDKNDISRKLFFTKYEDMLAAANTLIKAQQTTRVKSYKLLKSMPDNGISKRMLVKHTITSQGFVM